jgi:GNAT superfamily N-acetyltransferase
MVTVRRATADEASAIVEVYQTARAGAGVAIPPEIHSDQEVRSWIAHFVLPTQEVWVAVDDGVDGLLVLQGNDVEMLYVHPRAQRTGIGSALLAHAKAVRPGGLALWTFESNLRARQFYEARGFAAVRRTDDDNEERAPDIRYVWGNHTERLKPGNPGDTAANPPNDNR